VSCANYKTIIYADFDRCWMLLGNAMSLAYEIGGK